MKIFNWINLKLHPSCTNYSQVPQEKDIVLDHGDGEGEAAIMTTEKKSAETEKETTALLLHDMFNGILAIGTLGHCHPLLLQSAYAASAEEESAEEDQAIKKDGKEEDEVPPSMDQMAALEQKEAVTMAAAAAVLATSTASTDQRSSEISAAAGELFKIARDEEASKTELMLIEAADPSEIEKILELPLLTDQDRKADQLRTTLADLFAADASFNSRKSKEMINSRGNRRNCSNYNQESKSHRKEEERQTSDEKKDVNAEKSTTLSNAKSTRKKLQKLMTRMLKRKIHPEAAAATGAAKEAAAAKPSRGGVAGREASHGLAPSIWYLIHLSDRFNYRKDLQKKIIISGSRFINLHAFHNNNVD